MAIFCDGIQSIRIFKTAIDRMALGFTGLCFNLKISKWKSLLKICSLKRRGNQSKADKNTKSTIFTEFTALCFMAIKTFAFTFEETANLPFHGWESWGEIGFENLDRFFAFIKQLFDCKRTLLEFRDLRWLNNRVVWWNSAENRSKRFVDWLAGQQTDSGHPLKPPSTLESTAIFLRMFLKFLHWKRKAHSSIEESSLLIQKFSEVQNEQSLFQLEIFQDFLSLGYLAELSQDSARNFSQSWRWSLMYEVHCTCDRSIRTTTLSDKQILWIFQQLE